MSAMTATIRDRDIVMMTDAAFYDTSTGVLTHLRSKAWQVPKIPAAFSSRGFSGAFEIFEAACWFVDYSSWDEFVAMIDEVWFVYDALCAAFAPGYDAQIMICGWSDKRDSGEVLWRNSLPEGQYGLPGRATLKWSEGSIAFGVDGKKMPVVGFDARVHGIPAFEEARCFINDLTCGREEMPVLGHAVGGWVDCTIITRTSVETRTIHEWADVVGEKINPASMEAIAA